MTQAVQDATDTEDVPIEMEVFDQYFCCIASLIFFISAGLIACSAYKSFRSKRTMVNASSMLVVILLIFTLLLRICSLLFVLFAEETTLEADTVKMWVFFELPFACIMSCSLILFFEW